MGEPAVKSQVQELNASSEVRFSPEALKNGRFDSWLRDSKDWCLSRQRTWGCPLPVWECKKEKGGCGRLHCVGSRSELQSLLADPARVLMKQMDLHATQVDALQLRCAGCGNQNGSMCREPYVLDCWFDSGCAPFAQWHYPFAFSNDSPEHTDSTSPVQYNGSAHIPVDFVAEGHDQCRGWFYSLLALSSTLFDRPAYKHCLALGLLLDKDGYKMSKSKGNVVDPWEHFNEEGADALRWYMLGMCAPWTDRRFNKKMVRTSNQKFFRVLYNVAKWWHVHWQGSQKESFLEKRQAPAGKHMATESCGVLDRWVLSRLAFLVGNCNKHFKSDSFHLAVASLEDFLNEDLSKTYLRLSRAHFQCGSDTCKSGGDNYAAQLSCLHTMREVLVVLCRLVAPLAPFFVDRLHRSLMATKDPITDLPGGGSNCGVNFSVHLASWPVAADFEGFCDLHVEADVQLLRSLMQAGNVMREKGTRPGRLPFSHGYCVAFNERSPDVNNQPVLSEELAGFLAFGLNVSEVTSLQSQEAFEALLNKVQVPSLAPNMSNLGARFKGEANMVVQALQESMGQRFVTADPTVLLSANSEAPNTDERSYTTKSKNQLKREKKAEVRQRKKEGAKKSASTPMAAMSGPLVEESLRQLLSQGTLQVCSSTGKCYELLPADLNVLYMDRPDFLVSVQSLSGSPRGGGTKWDLTTGLVLDLAVSPLQVSTYLTKEVLHFIQMLRKSLEKKLLREGNQQLEQVKVRVVVHTRGDGHDHDPNHVGCLLSNEQWAWLLQETQAECMMSSLEQDPEDALLQECEEAVSAGLMEQLSVRGFGCCPSFLVFVRLDQLDGC